MSISKMCSLGLQAYHLDPVVEETTSAIVMNLDKQYNQGQFEYLMQYGGLSQNQIILKSIMQNIDQIESIVIATPDNADADYQEAFVGKINDLDYEQNTLLVNNADGDYYTISPEVIDLINFKNDSENKKIKSYLKSRRRKCIECDAIEGFSYGKLHMCGESILQYIFCKNCKSEWVCEYTVTSVHVSP